MRAKRKQYFVYLLECADHSLYTGSTLDLEKRMQTHAKGMGSKYVRSRRPFKLVYTEIVATWSAALKREAAIKQWTRPQKLALITTNKVKNKKGRIKQKQSAMG